jgi:multidrug efflux pump subunit AcrA (membrane-fusion protein)
VTQPTRTHGAVVGALALKPAERPAPATPALHAVGDSVQPNAGRPAPQAANAPLQQANKAPAQPASGPLAHGSEELLKLIRTALASLQSDRSAAALATELATAFASDRVFVGITARRFVRVAGLSHGAVLGNDQVLSRVVGAAMDEAVDQGASILYPQHPDDRPRITLAHAELARQGNGNCTLTVPMFSSGQPVGALTFERPQAARFDALTVRHIEIVAQELAPLLLLKFGRRRSAWQRLRGALGLNAALDKGQRLTLVFGAMAAIGALAALLASSWTFQVSAPTRLEGQVQRAVVAPVDGFLKSVHVRAGDSVREGQLLAELSDEDLRLERRRWESEVARYENTYAEAQAKADRTQLVIADARVAESRAQLALVDQQLARTQLLAPFDALVIKGDLSQQLGAPVKRGDLLLTLTPSRDVRVMLEIDERDVGHVKPGAKGAVTLSALPDRSFPLVIERVMPVARAEPGRNLFEAEARMDAAAAAAASGSLRPGLQGMARVDAGQHPLVWLVSHRVLDWLRLQWWSWVG